jgi:hypothetical protein
MTFWPIVVGRGVVVPSVVRAVVVPLYGSGRPEYGDPPFFDIMDPADVDIFSWDWSVIDFPHDGIIGFSVTSQPPLITIGTPILFGTLIQVFVGPGPVETYDLTCQAIFSTGRVLDWGVRLDVEPL